MNLAESATKTILSIQRDYRAIIGQLITTQEVAEARNWDQSHLRRFVAEKLLNSRSKIKVPGGSITPFEERLNQIAHQVFSFWKSNGESIAAALRTLEGFKLTSSISGLTTTQFGANVRRLCIYFDTLVLICPIHEGKERLESRYGPREMRDQDEIQAKVHIAVNIINLLLTEPLLATDTAMPIIVVVPDFYASLSNCRDVDLFSGSRMIAHITGITVNFSDRRGLREVPGKLLERYESDKSFQRIFDELLSAEYGEHLPAALRMDALKTAPFDVKAAYFISNVGEANTDFNILSSCAAETAADPVVLSHKQNIFRAYLEASAKEAKERFEIACGESLIANGLLARKMGFLEALTFDELRLIRSKGILEQTRQELRQERDKFRTASYDRLDAMSLSFADRVVEIINEAAKAHTDRSGKLNADIRKNVVYFAGACAVGAASIALPQTLLLEALGIGYSAVIGGTALEVTKAIREKRDEKARFKKNPLGILYRALTTSRPTCTI